jgi:serine/threonine protein kinase
MFLDEWRKLEGLSHEGIVRVYGVLQHQGSPVIVQELVQGGTLRELLNRAGGCLPLEQAVSLTMDICKALVYLHSQKIYHRDLKPDNVLLNESGRAKLMDFGLALHRSDRSSTPYAVAGSLAYMAPEQILGKAHLQDGRCDLWAVGVMLYEMIVGERPFQESSPADLKRAILHGAATPPHQIKSSIPRALGDICQSCLERKLRNRYSSAQDGCLLTWKAVFRQSRRNSLSSCVRPGPQPPATPIRVPVPRLVLARVRVAAADPAPSKSRSRRLSCAVCDLSGRTMPRSSCNFCRAGGLPMACRLKSVHFDGGWSSVRHTEHFQWA